MLLPIRKAMWLPSSAPTSAVLIDSGLPALPTYRQYLHIKLYKRILSLPHTHHINIPSYYSTQAQHILNIWNLQADQLQNTDIRKLLHIQQQKDWEQATTAQFMRDILQVHICNNGSMQPYMKYDNKTTAAYRCRLRMRRTYLAADALRNKYPGYTNDKCTLCNTPQSVMDAEHILLHCPYTQTGRNKCKAQLRKKHIDMTLKICLGEVDHLDTAKQQYILQHTGQYIQYIATITII